MVVHEKPGAIKTHN